LFIKYIFILEHVFVMMGKKEAIIGGEESGSAGAAQYAVPNSVIQRKAGDLWNQ
jgi:hypothetical protein